MFYVENEAQPDKFSSIPQPCGGDFHAYNGRLWRHRSHYSMGKFLGGIFALRCGLLSLARGILSPAFLKCFTIKMLRKNQ
jgi:hypothetical protein